MIAKLLAKPVAWAIGALLIIAAIFWLYSAVTAKPKAEAKLSRNQAEAASKSGAEAVNTVGKAGEREAASADLSRTNEQEIRHAEGADAPVAAPVRDAGLASLCRRDSYKRDPRCLPKPAAR